MYFLGGFAQTHTELGFGNRAALSLRGDSDTAALFSSRLLLTRILEGSASRGFHPGNGIESADKSGLWGILLHVTLDQGAGAGAGAGRERVKKKKKRTDNNLAHLTKKYNRDPLSV